MGWRLQEPDQPASGMGSEHGSEVQDFGKTCCMDRGAGKLELGFGIAAEAAEIRLMRVYFGHTGRE